MKKSEIRLKSENLHPYFILLGRVILDEWILSNTILERIAQQSTDYKGSYYRACAGGVSNDHIPVITM